VVYVDKDAQGGVYNGKEWDTAYRNLRVAINNAVPGSCIWVARGRYYPTNGTDETISFDITKSLTLLGGFRGDELCIADRAGFFQATALSGDIGSALITDNSDRIVTIEGPFDLGQPPHVIIDGFSIGGAHNALLDGGGVYSFGAGSLTLRNCWIQDNQAGRGGGVFVAFSDLEMLDCTFVRNRAFSEGGGLWAGGVESQLVPGEGAHVYNTRFADNGVDDLGATGGAVFLTDIADGEEVQFMNCVLAANEGTFGAAYYLADGTEPGRARIWNTTISGNTSTGSGSALFAEENAEAVIWNSSIWEYSPAGPTTVVQDAVNDVLIDYTTVEDGMTPFECIPSPDCFNQGTCTNWSCDPQFAGGLTLMCFMSPAIDQGEQTNPDTPKDVFDVDEDLDTGEDMPFDKNGDSRVQGMEIDRGAFETCSP
jgi:hypothetical protein